VSAVRYRVCDCEAYWVDIDQYDVDGSPVCFVHIRFNRFTKDILKQALIEWRVLRTVITCPLLAYPEDDNDKWRAFVSLFGFKPTDTEIVCNNGEKRRLYISIVDNHVRQSNSEPTAAEPDTERKSGRLGTVPAISTAGPGGVADSLRTIVRR
jgi:hypothetical protein